MSERIGLGDTAQDTISGYQGLCVAVTDWLYGCRRVTLQAQALHDGRPVDSVTFDEPQLRLISKRETAGTVTPGSGPAKRPGGPRPEPTRNATPGR